MPSSFVNEAYLIGVNPKALSSSLSEFKTKNSGFSWPLSGLHFQFHFGLQRKPTKIWFAFSLPQARCYVDGFTNPSCRWCLLFIFSCATSSGCIIRHRGCPDYDVLLIKMPSHKPHTSLWPKLHWPLSIRQNGNFYGTQYHRYCCARNAASLAEPVPSYHCCGCL